MNVLIVEDETAAATNLKALLLQIDPSIRIEAVIETVVETVRWVNRFHDRVRPLCARCFQGQQHRLHSQTDQERGASPGIRQASQTVGAASGRVC